MHDYCIADDWYQYRDEALGELAIAWCEENGIKGRAIIMITIMFHATAKTDKVEEARAMAIKAAEVTRAEEEGCLTYVLHQQRDNPREFVIYEQYRDQDAVNAHFEHLYRLFGPPAPGGRLPTAFIDVCDETKAIRYDVVA